jgi:hypothetical protein
MHQELDGRSLTARQRKFARPAKSLEIRVGSLHELQGNCRTRGDGGNGFQQARLALCDLGQPLALGFKSGSIQAKARDSRHDDGYRRHDQNGTEQDVLALIHRPTSV